MSDVKESLRQEIKHVLRGLNAEEYQRRSGLLEAQLLQYLITLDHHSPLSIIGVYFPLRGEPRLETERWAQFPWQLAYPSPKADGMHYRLPTSTLPARGHWLGEGEECEPDLIVIPGLVFTPQGYRIGRGGGFYDRLLARWRPRLGCVGVCFEEQLRQGLSLEAHDQKLNVIITDTRLLHCEA